MNDLLNLFFGLGDIRFGGADTRFEFARAIPAWAWAGAAIVAGVVAAGGYARLVGAARARAVLGGVRALTLMLILFFALGPHLVRERSRTERDWTVVLADRSASMTIADAPGALTRDAQLARALGASEQTWRDLQESKRVLWLGFDAGAYELSVPEGGTLPELDEADGARTSLGDAIDQALRRVAARPVSGIVVLSDGRTSEPIDRAVRRRLESDQIPVFSVPLGSPEPATDLAIRSVESPGIAFVRDATPVRIEIERLGRGAIPEGSRVEIVDSATGLTLAERQIDVGLDAGEAVTELTLTPRVDTAGDRGWTVRLIPGGRDLVPENNERQIAIELVDRPLRVLYIDGYPRWENRYLKNTLLREGSVQSSGLLLAADRRYTQEGDVSLVRLPVSPSEWEPFDVVILGDLSPELFGAAQLEALREHVASRGAGLLWIAGPGHTPSGWFASALGDLLPIRSGGGGLDAARVDPWGEAVTLVRTPEGERLGVLAMGDETGGGWPVRLSDPGVGWTRLRWAQRIDPARVKPAAQALALAVPESAYTPALIEGVVRGESAPGSVAPGVLTMRYGAGRVVYVATDEIWRWRYGRGEALPERFWLPLVRLLGREGLARAGRPALLSAAPERALTGEAVRIGLELLDQSLVDASPASIRVEITARDGSGDPIEMRLAPDAAVEGGARTFGGVWATSEPGEFDVRVTEPLLAAYALSTTIDIARPDDERRRPETDHPTLVQLAESTGGSVVLPEELSRLGELLPNREQIFTGPRETRTLWDRPGVLALLITLLGLEWIGRRLIRLA